ncbi:putative sulfate exporter family transporter [Halomonas saccharevitans]|uniref:Sulfate exporter family transporter n=1 Tax=Halomonas saccharevitans TaxID=416872 RepID=A0ABU3NBN6_9GAMM|nr:putative sulfate exporter family transporter [Halomonas saccharevitans]MDT8878601.1 putative sulfate exporter family transporter [Halomonas saccharevitans]
MKTTLFDTPLAERLGRATPIGRGLLVCVTIALATTFIADHYGGPTLLYALLFGMSLHFLSEEGRCRQGIEFAARTVLRLGVALLGARMTLAQVGDLGIGPVLTVVVAVALVIAMGSVLARVLGLDRDLGLLTGGAVAICGASAALALSAVMPRHETHERNTILTVVGVTTLSTMAMVIYPLIAGALELANAQAGIFLGGTIHDVAQVVGAGYMISEETGDISTLVKLVRVAMLVPAVMVFMWLFRASRQAEGAATKVPMLPSFLVGFVVLVLVNSMGLIPEVVNEGMSTLSRWCLVTAIAALGIKTSFQKLAVVGWKPVILMALETLFLLVVVLGVVLIGGLGT